MAANLTPQYLDAEVDYKKAQTPEERLECLKKMYQLVPKHKASEKLQAELKTNLVVLATAHAVSEGIMRRLSGDLARKACPQVYGASGRANAPDPKRAQPLAFSRTL